MVRRRAREAKSPTSAEHLARWIFDRWAGEFPELTVVRVSETPKTWAVYQPE
ncbi:6-carboxytetrahydropterin synthase [Streptomyces sp. P38-E01]|uniref:6-carboxy-5,6,7,8-tetrahydropterin synthase n=1 Tax=Streptomyces tardus TaxID=2780544 RepID=A0A949JR97_9ACTN|nr:6-carboxytetrahydropterin synthase [Streptomyces tardus]MBU7600804.1 6-carboxytetrahydropterin synthase [Streptomyces tardus]